VADDLGSAGPKAAAPAAGLTLAPPGRRRVAAWAASASLACWAVAVVASLGWLWVRPPCPPGYVRLVDFGELVPVVAGAGVLASAAALLLVRRRVLYRTLCVLTCASTAVALLVVAANAASVISNLGAQFDGGCWTF